MKNIFLILIVSSNVFAGEVSYKIADNPFMQKDRLARRKAVSTEITESEIVLKTQLTEQLQRAEELSEQLAFQLEDIALMMHETNELTPPSEIMMLEELRADIQAQKDVNDLLIINLSTIIAEKNKALGL